MVWDLFYQILLIVLGAAIPPLVTKIFSRFPLGKLRPNIVTQRISVVSTLVAVSLIAASLSAYDRGYLPFMKTASVQVVKYQFGKPYQNTNRGSLIVTVSSTNTHPGNTMCASVVDSYRKLPVAKIANCKDGSTVAAASFIAANFQSSMTFVVPRGYWYNVTVDGEVPEPTLWTEVLL